MANVVEGGTLKKRSEYQDFLAVAIPITEKEKKTFPFSSFYDNNVGIK